MNQDKIKEKVMALCNNIFLISAADTDLNQYIDFVDDFGMDSIKFITLVVEIEACFGITFFDEMLLIDNFKNVKNIVKIIIDRLVEKNSCNSNGSDRM